MSGRWLVPAALVVLLTACDDAPTPSASSNPTPSASAEGLTVPQPDHPLDAGALLSAMRESRRPGGVPDELETDAVASDLAAAIWTFDGGPWNAVSAGGSCGPESCTLEISGASDGAQGDDVWVFGIAPETGAVQLQTTDLRSLPTDLIGRLDAVTRSLVSAATLDGLALTNVRWLPPPDDGQFVLSYRSGGEEGSCGADVRVDAVVPVVLSGSSSNC